MKSKLLILMPFLILGLFYVTCTHDDEILSTGPKVSRGNNIHLAGVATGDTSQWKFDKSHSSVLWQTTYVGASGLLTGRFNQFGLHDVSDSKSTFYLGTTQPLPDTSWAFYENEPNKSYFNGYVQINTSNTGEPGRDAGCNISGMGTVGIKKDTQNLNITNLAKIRSREIRFDPASNDYLVTIDLTWQGKLTAPLTKTLPAKLKYIPRTRVQFGTAAAYHVFGLQLTFQLNCRDYGITSTSVHDIIEVTCNTNFHNK